MVILPLWQDRLPIRPPSTMMPTEVSIKPMSETTIGAYDVVVVGGGAAGSSAAVVLARARRSVVVVDAGTPRNSRADGVHSFLTRDGMRPSELIEIGHHELTGYGGVLVGGEVQAARRTADGFDVRLEDGRCLTARRLLIATGLVDELPDVAGVRERWGRDVLHCPYCHGWEVRDQAVGVLGSSPRAVHQALLFRQWTADLVLFTHTAPALSDAEAEQLAARGIRVVPGRVDALEVIDDRLTGLRLHDGTLVARQALAVAPRFVARSAVLATLGLQPTAHPLGMGEFIAGDTTGLTDVPGVWVAGNVADLTATVIGSAAQGVSAAAAINADLIAEDTRRAVTAYRHRRAAGSELVTAT
jgi:thioredoxin reductase